MPVEEEKVVEQELIINGDNFCFITGYIVDKKLETKKDKPFVSFKLGHNHTAKNKELYTDFFKVTFDGFKAKDLDERFKDGDYVRIQGILRSNEGLGRVKIIGVHVKGAEQIKKKVKIKVPKED